jgi:NADPH:quinone reductase-like Zn-dependent oxidoreductase
MKAITLRDFGGPEMMQISEVEKPSPAEGQILIKVMNSSVNRPDIIQREGNYPPPPGDSEILGLEVAGVVESNGNNATRFAPGDRVVALVGGGGYAEYALAREDHSMTIPDSVSFEQAACICETYITAYLNLFILGELQGKQSVLIHGGGGGVATAAIQLCRALTPDTGIIVTASSAKLERVAEQGADHVIDYREQEFAIISAQSTCNRI